MSASVLYTYDGKEISEDNPLPVKMAGAVDENVLEDYYTKDESDNKYQAKGDYATQSALQTLQELVESLQTEIESLKEEEED